MTRRIHAGAVLLVLILLPLLAGAAGAAHPQLYFSSADVAGLKTKVAAEPYRSWFAGVQQLAQEPVPNGPSLSQQDWVMRRGRSERTHSCTR